MAGKKCIYFWSQLLIMASRLRQQPLPKDLPVYSRTLSNGRVVEMRQALTQDMLYISNIHGSKSELEQGIFMMARLATGKEPITIDEIQILSVQDLYTLGELVAQCTGSSGVEEDEDPLAL